MRRKNLRPASQIQADYEKNAAGYDNARFGTVGGQYVNRREQEVVATIIKGSRVLEVGTATGRFATSLNQCGAEYVGVDLSLKMLRTTFERTNHSASLIQMDASQL